MALEPERKVERRRTQERLLHGQRNIIASQEKRVTIDLIQKRVSEHYGEPTEFLRQSFGYKLPHRGTTRSDAGQNEFSRMTDGDGASYWKSNPYLTEKFTGESDALHPQWVVLDFSAAQDISAMETAWANLSARRFVIEYWTGKEDAITKQNGSSWVKFPNGGVSGDRGEQATEALG